MKTTLDVQNVKCNGCANTIITKLSELDQVTNVSVDNDTGKVTFSYENDADFSKAKTLLAKLGYPAVGEKNALTTKAKSFVSCAVGRMSN